MEKLSEKERIALEFHAVKDWSRFGDVAVRFSSLAFELQVALHQGDRQKLVDGTMKMRELLAEMKDTGDEVTEKLLDIVHPDRRKAS